MITAAVDTDIYNYMAIFEIAEELMILNFNCVYDLSEEWKLVGNFLIESIKEK